MASAPVPTLNDSAPPVNLMERFTDGQPGSLPSFDISGIVPVVFTLLFVIWVAYTLIVIYHWFRYHHRSWFAVPAIVLHFFVSGAIILYMVSGLR